MSHSTEPAHVVPHRLGRTARRLGGPLRLLATGAAAYLGGVAATNLWPVRVDVSHYRAVLRLHPWPRREPVAHLPTIAGDVDLTFASPAVSPGLDVSLSVTEDITGLVKDNNLSLEALQPTEEQITAAVQAASTGMAGRFVLGAVVVPGGIVLAVASSRHRPPDRAQVARVATAVTLVTGLVGAGVASTFRPANFVTYTASGALGLVVRDTQLLRDISSRSGQVTPYLRNLLAMSAALQQAFVPPAQDTSVGLRLLLVSDLHGANLYPFMRQIIEDERIDAVIDAGDLVNFGHAEELWATGMLTGIESLGVPYIVVTGNHDNASPTDTRVLTELSRVSNVELLQTPDGQFREVTLKGLRIAGLNDTRWMGDDDRDYPTKLRPNLQAFNAAWQSEPAPDVVVIHEPYLLGELQHGRITVNGHMHTADLRGRHIQVGTFTGGGILSHFRPEDDEPGAELVGQPYSFDIATFAPDCTLAQLTRFSYRDLLEGRPQYDRVQVINGATIDPLSPASATGTCGPDVPSGSRTLSKPAP